ncbi:MAG TPA: radical SAM protein [Alphaproteobacteria bacterium]|nr:radical SAM protein [Alphaproteobacteria bacterium]
MNTATSGRPQTEPHMMSHVRGAGRVVLVGFLEQENLGLGYLAATLRREGRHVTIVDFQEDHRTILETIRREQPIVVGFSLIFQFYVHRFGALIRYLRENGVGCHFTIGGHFPSLSYQHALELIPELDSVVRFEGEQTLVELVDTVEAGGDWRFLLGIAFKSGGEVMANALRPLVRDLDDLPYPERGQQPMAVLGRKALPILASRGCVRTCSFCSIHVFYRAAPGKVVRTRKPVEIVREMRMLHDERGITVFLFQDDDFPLFGPVWQRWTREFIAELYRAQLAGKVIWKINCRADAVDPVLFAEMKEAGLYYVYMGLESGSEDGLETLNKDITVAENIRAVEILKSLGLVYEFGFMLFDPSTTFDSVRDNVAFLRQIAGDGSASAAFCRMLPYDGTPIKDVLAKEGRLKGDVCDPDYDYLDPRVDAYFQALTGLLRLTGWIHGNPGLSPQLKFAWNEYGIMERLFPDLPDIQDYKKALKSVTAASNAMLFKVIEDISYAITEGRPHEWTSERLRTEGARFIAQFREARDGFVLHNQDVFRAALGEREMVSA